MTADKPTDPFGTAEPMFIAKPKWWSLVARYRWWRVVRDIKAGIFEVYFPGEDDDRTN